MLKIGFEETHLCFYIHTYKMSEFLNFIDINIIQNIELLKLPIKAKRILDF